MPSSARSVVASHGFHSGAHDDVDVDVSYRDGMRYILLWRSG